MSWAQDWFASNLVCPYDESSLAPVGDRLVCAAQHAFPVVHGVPVLLRRDLAPTHHIWRTTDEDITRLSAGDATPANDGAVDPFVERWIVGTCGRLYLRRGAPLSRYPIPDIELPPGEGRILVDVGSNWGRWALAAARAGYRVVAIDPSLEATLAGARIARQLDLAVSYVVADARRLPLRTGCVDVGYSNGVLQHLDKEVVRQALAELHRVTRRGGTIRVQMANVLGLLRLFNHTRETLALRLQNARGAGRTPYPFRVRPWTPSEILRTFRELIGPTTMVADSYFSLGARATDLDLVNRRSAIVIRLSRALCKASTRVPGLAYVADSVVVEALNEA